MLANCCADVQSCARLIDRSEKKKKNLISIYIYKYTYNVYYEILNDVRRFEFVTNKT